MLDAYFWFLYCTVQVTEIKKSYYLSIYLHASIVSFIFQSVGCPLPPPTFPYAHVTSNPVSNTKGSYVTYDCDLGYISDNRPTRLLCDKDPKTQGYKWNGNFTCQS